MMEKNVNRELSAATDLPLESQTTPQQRANDTHPISTGTKEDEKISTANSTGTLGEGLLVLPQKRTQNESTSKMPLWLKFLIATLILSVITFAVISFVFSTVAVPLIPIVFAGLANIHNALAFASVIAGGTLVLGAMISGIVALTTKTPVPLPAQSQEAPTTVSPMRRLSMTSPEADLDTAQDSPHQTPAPQSPLHQDVPVEAVIAGETGQQQAILTEPLGTANDQNSPHQTPPPKSPLHQDDQHETVVLGATTTPVPLPAQSGNVSPLRRLSKSSSGSDADLDNDQESPPQLFAHQSPLHQGVPNKAVVADATVHQQANLVEATSSIAF